MKLTANREVFASALDLLVGPGAQVEKKVLYSVLLNARPNGTIEAVSTNLDVQIATTIPANVTQPGSRALPATKLLAMVNSLPSENASLAHNDSTGIVRISGGPVVFGSPSYEASEFPQSAAIEPELVLTVDQKALATVLRSVAFCQSTDPRRPVLNSTLLTIEQRVIQSTITAIATDGRSLARSSCVAEVTSAPVKDRSVFRYVVSRQTVSEILRMSSSLVENFSATVRLDPRQIGLSLRSEGPEDTTRDIQLTSRLLSAQYPDIGRVLSNSTPRGVSFEVDVLKDTLQRILVVTTSESEYVHVSLSEDSARFKASSSSDGTASDMVPYANPSTLQKPVSVMINPRQLLGMIKPFAGHTLILKLSDTTDDPTAVFLEVDGHPHYRGILMPLRRSVPAAAPATV